MKKIIGVLILSIMMLTTTVLAAFPEELEESESYNGLIQLTSEDMVETNMIEDDIYKMEQVVTLDQEVIDGNVYVMAKELNLTGTTIYGDVYVMAETVRVQNSEIRGSVYAMAESMTFLGSVNDIYAMGNVIDINEETTVWRSARIFSNSLNVHGKIRRNLWATVRMLNVSDKAKIDGNLNYASKEEGDVSEMAQIGKIEFSQLQEQEEYIKTPRDYLFELSKMAFKTLIIALMIVFFVSKFKSLSRKNIASDFLKSTGKGIGVFMVIPILAVALVFSIIGSALGVALIAIYSVMLYIAISVVSVEVAYRILTKIQKENNFAMIGVSILISVILGAIGFVPGIGGAIRLIAIFIGLGVLFDVMFKKVKNETNNGEINEN